MNMLCQEQQYVNYVVLVNYVPQPGDSEVTFSVFESSCHLLLPV